MISQLLLLFLSLNFNFCLCLSWTVIAFILEFHRQGSFLRKWGEFKDLFSINCNITFNRWISKITVSYFNCNWWHMLFMFNLFGFPRWQILISSQFYSFWLLRKEVCCVKPSISCYINKSHLAYNMPLLPDKFLYFIFVKISAFLFIVFPLQCSKTALPFLA